MGNFLSGNRIESVKKQRAIQAYLRDLPQTLAYTLAQGMHTLACRLSHSTSSPPPPRALRKVSQLCFHG